MDSIEHIEMENFKRKIISVSKLLILWSSVAKFDDIRVVKKGCIQRFWWKWPIGHVNIVLQLIKTEKISGEPHSD